MSAISLQNVIKTYEKTEALKGITFDIAPGDFFGFLGPNGAGKTTTINLITGLATLTSGTIQVQGYNVESEYREARRLIGLAAQEPNFDPFFPIHKVLTFQAGYHGLPKSIATERAKLLLKRFDLWEHREKTSRKISGGMKRRLLIAKALVHDPEILILDEPTAGVDVELRHSLWKYIEELNKEGKTIVLTTHYIEEAEKLCNTIGIINKGKMMAIEEKDVLMQRLADKETMLSLEQVDVKMKEEMQEIQKVRVNGNQVFFPAEHSTEILHKLSGIIQKYGIDILDMDIEAANLEDIFVDMTNKKNE